ncbi:hypothetical protein [uncultured Thioclava sp.]|uniref:hypothetical protein n=1 Tax=uncultured Thioclava sp. TaxID=473858 RepID=UPI0025FA0696|nr:hypothetical protein [uncultured Thioclava sp.]
MKPTVATPKTPPIHAKNHHHPQQKMARERLIALRFGFRCTRDKSADVVRAGDFDRKAIDLHIGLRQRIWAEERTRPFLFAQRV